MDRLSASAAVVAAVIVGAETAADELSGLAAELLRPTTIGAAMVVAYRVTVAAHRESSATYRAAARDAEERADAAEARLDAYRKSTDAHIASLVAELRELRNEKNG